MKAAKTSTTMTKSSTARKRATRSSRQRLLRMAARLLLTGRVQRAVSAADVVVAVVVLAAEPEAPAVQLRRVATSKLAS